MTSVVVAVLVITLLLPGLVLLFAVVLRYLLREGPRLSQGRQPDFVDEEDAATDSNGHADTLH